MPRIRNTAYKVSTSSQSIGNILFTWLLKLATEKDRVEGNLRNLLLLLSGVSFWLSGVAIAAPSFPLSAAIAAPSNWSRDPPPADLLVDPADLLER
jgi:hypothetical protein